VAIFYELPLQQVNLCTSTSQFGFKKGQSCAQAVFSARKVVDLFSRHGSTVNMCSLDISKAFNRGNHVKLFIKLADCNVPVKLIYILISWFAIMETCVRWGITLSYTVRPARFGTLAFTVLCLCRWNVK